MKIFILLIFFSSALCAHDICERSNNDIVTLLKNSDSRIQFRNQGGLFNRGVCWWHARLQRSSAYLSTFAPNDPRPDQETIKTILRHLQRMDRVVEIPGFSNFAEFSVAHQSEIQTTFNHWQMLDGFVNQQWIRGISGHSKLSENKMKRRMQKIFEAFSQSPTPIWLLAQMKGLSNHGILLLDMISTQDGYELTVIDSNDPKISKKIVYKYGQNFLKIPGSFFTFVPYIGFQRDFKKMFKTINHYCERKTLDEFVQDGEIELK